MQSLAQFATPKGAVIDLCAASHGAVTVVANGKFVGMLESIDQHSEHGAVIRLKGVSAVVAVGSAVQLVRQAIEQSRQIAAQAAKEADRRWAEYAQTPEGRVEALRFKIEQANQEPR